MRSSRTKPNNYRDIGHIFMVLMSLLSFASHAVEIPSWMTLEKKEIKDEVWPELHIKALINADPLGAAGIFAAYDYQKSYVPGVLKSDVVKEEVEGKENVTDVSYVLDMPWPLSDSHYTHGHILTSPEEGSYKVSWYIVKSDSAEMIKGSALFSPHPTEKGKTLLTYISLVRPKSFLAGIFKKIMVGDVIKSLTAIKETTEGLIKKDPSFVEKYRDKIRQVLSGKRAYLP